MYNISTEEKIKQIPPVGDIDIDRLPQDLTKIYAQIVSLRREVVEGTLNLQDNELVDSISFLQKLANNLEVLLLTSPKHPKKEAIAFVAATANSLIFKIGMFQNESDPLLDVNRISPFIASIILFLIGNSQADAAEMAISLPLLESLEAFHKKLILSIMALGTGKLNMIINQQFTEEEINNDENIESIALNYLWREIGLGIQDLALDLTSSKRDKVKNDHFEKVIDLSVSEVELFKQKDVYSGPYRMAKLLKILQVDILNRGVINIDTPSNVDEKEWNGFLEKLAKDRPYLWENHKDAVSTGFLNPGISAVLTLPTGSGKSTLSELKLASCLYSGQRAIYLVPTHALEDQVNKNLKELFSNYDSEYFEFDNEYTEIGGRADFSVLVMTPERCLTLLNTSPDFFSNLGLVVFDEFHLIHGTDIKKDRRSVDAMYCLLSLFTLRPQADYLLISAMVENGSEICEWIKSITNRECVLFNSSWKPTRQLHGCIVYEEIEVSTLNEQIREFIKVEKKTINPPVGLRRSMKISPNVFFSLKNIWETTKGEDYFRAKIIDEQILLGINDSWELSSNRNDVAAKLASHFSKLGLKTLVFVDDPRIANATAVKIAEELGDRDNSYKNYLIANNGSIESLIKELGNIESSYFHDHKNVGIHHGLIFPVERNLIEQYFKEMNGAIALVATATLAQGINLPAEIVIIAGDDRFNEDKGRREEMQPHELLNAAGRAGRAGQSSQGAVLLIPGNIVTINDSVISNRWWSLKERVFSKGDQCLNIEDPLEYFLDSIKDDSRELSIDQTNILYRFKSENLSEHETKKLFKNSFYAYKAIKNNEVEDFEAQVVNLLARRKELDDLSEDIIWTKELSFKTGIDPTLILELGNAIDTEDFENFISYSVIEYVDWYFNWLQSNPTFLERIYLKATTINQIKKAVGLKQDIEIHINQIIERLPLLRDELKQFLEGVPLNALEKSIPNSVRPDSSPYLVKARNFVIRLVPELSFSFGLLSMIIIEKGLQKGLEKEELSWTIRALGSCIREGFDQVEKLFYKKENRLLMRVETHQKYDEDNIE